MDEKYILELVYSFLILFVLPKCCNQVIALPDAHTNHLTSEGSSLFMAAVICARKQHQLFINFYDTIKAKKKIFDFLVQIT